MHKWIGSESDNFCNIYNESQHIHIRTHTQALDYKSALGFVELLTFPSNAELRGMDLDEVFKNDQFEARCVARSVCMCTCVSVRGI
jgi:hypothetical protein